MTITSKSDRGRPRAGAASRLSKWSQHQRNQIADMLRAEKTARQIAAHFGVSRNAIIGLVSRDKTLREIGFAHSPGPQNTGRKRDLSIAAKRRRGAVRGGKVSLNRISAIPMPAAPVVETPPCADAPDPLNLMLIDLTERTCKWPVNSGGPYHFCGHEKEPGGPYCAYHAELAVGSGTESERSAIRSALKVAA